MRNLIIVILESKSFKLEILEGLVNALFSDPFLHNFVTDDIVEMHDYCIICRFGCETVALIIRSYKLDAEELSIIQLLHAEVPGHLAQVLDFFSLL